MTDRWFRFYDGALNDPKVQRLPPALFKTWVNLLCLASSCREDGTLPETTEDIAFALRMDPEECRRQIDALARAGLIDLQGGTGREVMHNWVTRQFNKPSDAPEETRRRKQEQRARDSEVVEGNAPEQVTPEPKNVSRDCHADVTPQTQRRDREDSETEKTQTHPLTPSPEQARSPDAPQPDAPAARCARDRLDGFDSLWAAYPSHAARAAAERAFAKLRPPPELLEQILAGVARAKQTEQWRRGVIPHLSTWLAGRRWADEPPPVPIHAGGGPSPVAPPIRSARGQAEAIAAQISRMRGQTQDARTES